MPYKYLNPKKEHTYKQYRDAGYSIHLAKAMVKVDKKQLDKGTKIEMEHTSDPKVAQKIATDHLRENKDYYKYTGKKGKEYLITKKKGDKIYVYKERDYLIAPDRVWTEDLKNPLKSHGAVKYRKYALSHSSKRNTRRQRKSSRLGEVY